MRSNENRRHYAKRRLSENAQLDVPERVQELGIQPFRFKDESIVVRFRLCPNIELLENYGVNNAILEACAARPPFHPELLTPLDFEKDWDAFSAALHGYRIRKYIDAQQERLRQYRSETKVSVSSALVRHFQHLNGLFTDYNKFAARYAKEGDSVREHICKHGAQWTATKMLYIKQDLQALAKTDDSYINVLYDRINHLLCLYGEEQE